LRKTIFQPSPGAAKEILLGLPVAFFRAAWDKYIVCPVASRFDFDSAWNGFTSAIDGIFGAEAGRGWGADAFFPSPLRNMIFDAGAERKLLRLTYDGRERLIEPYSLAYKRRRDGYAAEYFYGYDRTGGHSSGPGIKSFMRRGIQDIALTEDTFEPRYTIELSKAGETPSKGYFARPSFGRGTVGRTRTSVRRATFGHKQSYKIRCPYCLTRYLRERLAQQR
jgi:hypothetical protein